MRAEEKEVDGPDLDRQTRLTESGLDKQDEEELPEVLAEQQRELVRTERGGLLVAVEAILAHDHVVVDQLQLPAHELRALDALKAAVDGKDSKLHRFVFASDRRHLLEQALAVLQPNLAFNDASYAQLVARVAGLRHALTELEDSQDELLDGSQKEDLAKATPPKPPSEPTEIDPDAPKPPSTLHGPDVADAPKPASTLGGPEVREEPKPETSLGDPAEIAAAQADELPKKKPWWKRPFG